MAWRDLLYPQLCFFEPPERDTAIRRARELPFDVIELVGIAFGLVLVVSLTRYTARDFSSVDSAFLALANFVVAVPLLAVLVGPFLVRHVRRGLDEQLVERRRGGPPA